MDTMHLGGRLPLLDPACLTERQRAVYDRLRATMIHWADQSGFQSMTDNGRLIGPFNPVMLSPAIAPAFLDLQDAEQANTSLSERVRQVVILAVGAVWQAEYELYAHAAVARKAGLPDQVIGDVAHGAFPEGLSEQEKLAGRFARQLAAEHHVDPELYSQAEAVYGMQGLVDITFLVGIYQLVCGLLAAFEIPAPEAKPVASSRLDQTEGLRKATLTPAALFPPKSFLENLAVRSDNSVLVTCVTTKELFYVPTWPGTGTVTPVRLHGFEQIPTGIIEIEPEIFLICTSNLYTTHESYLYRLDLRNWEPGSPVAPELVFQFPQTARGLNGMCLVAPGVALVADCFASLIWRVDLQKEGREVQARVWLAHESMGYYPGKLKPEQPGVNAVRYAARTNKLYYTATAKKLLMCVPVAPETLDPAGPPELVVAGRMFDDFCIDEDAGVLYVTTHRQNTIDRVSMDPGENSGFTQSVAGDPFTEALIGPSSGAWSRRPGDYGNAAYFLCDGGTASPPPDGPQPAKLLWVKF